MRSPEVRIGHALPAVRAPDRAGIAQPGKVARVSQGQGAEGGAQTGRASEPLHPGSGATVACSGCTGCVSHFGLSFSPRLVRNSALRLLAVVVVEKPLSAPAFTKGQAH